MRSGSGVVTSFLKFWEWIVNNISN